MSFEIKVKFCVKATHLEESIYIHISPEQIDQGFSTMDSFTFPRGHLTMSGDIFGCRDGDGILLAFRG